MKIFGRDLNTLFENAALALTDQLIDTNEIRCKEEVIQEVQGETLSDLLINWLREVHFLFESKGFISKEARVEITPTDEGRGIEEEDEKMRRWEDEKGEDGRNEDVIGNSNAECGMRNADLKSEIRNPKSEITSGEYLLKGLLRGEYLDPAIHETKGEIKAVTYHRLNVEKTPSGWEAVVVFDV